MNALRICLALTRVLLVFSLTCFTQAHAQVPFNLTTGWNLLGNSSAAPIDVAVTFGDATKIATVWTWNDAGAKWAFYDPSMTPSDLTTYALSQGFDVLTSIAPKEGFWVNALAAVALSGPVASGLTLVESDLPLGWNLVGSADAKTPSQLNSGSLGSSLNAAGKRIVSAWAWDTSPPPTWKFYAPELEAQGGTVLADYITSHGYRPFTSALTAAEGFWLNIGTPTGPPPYYLSPSGLDSNDGLSASAPWKTFSKAWSVLQPGDTLLVADGSYSSPSPPAGKSGAAGSNIIIQAINPGGAQITALNLRGNSYLSFIGFKITGTQNAVFVESNGVGAPSHHLTFQQIGFTCTDVTLNDNECFGLGDGTHHVLLEDSWGWGGGRYTVMCYGGDGGSPPNLTCDYNTFRRLVLRMGPSTSTGGNPQAALALYYAGNNIVENVIALDGKPASDSSNSAFYITGHAPPPNADFNKFYGVIALNNLGAGLYVDCPGAVCNFTEVHNSVFWASAEYATAMGGDPGNCNNTIFDHSTMARAGGSTHGYDADGCTGTAITNNAFYSNGGYGARQGGTGSTTTNHHNGYFGNVLGARTGLSAGTGDLTSDPGFLYITRIEAASPYKSAGSSGDIGANVINRYQDGVLTGTALWPWPNEARIRTEMCNGVTGGWCSSGKTLTRYIWEYLGNTSPY